MIAISLGWGVQSFTMAAMSALGELPPVDVAIHADTTHERTDTYTFARKYTSWLVARGMNLVTVTDPSAPYNNGGFGPTNQPFIPVITESKHGVGRLRRQCTGRWKIDPIRRWLQANRNKKTVELWIGISTDEALRMRPSDVKYITHHWPLIEKRMSRNDCVVWLKSHDLEIPPKSACVFCPFHDARAWQELKRRGGEDWQRAIDVDNAIRKVRPPFDLFIHPTCIPLEQVDLRTPEQKGQMRLWDEECTGLCGV